MLDGVDIAGADLVEVSPLFDQSGATAFLGTSVMFEIPCHMVDVATAQADSDG